MAIIVEGFDNSGKSTLAASFGLEVLHPGPRPKNWHDEMNCMRGQQQLARTPAVLDRVTAISQPTYGSLSFDRYMPYILDLVGTQHCILIYCRPPIEKIMDFRSHTIAAHDDLKQIKWAEANAPRIIKNYDNLLRRVPHMVYDYTNPDQSVLEAAYNAQFTIGAWKQCKTLMNRA